MKTLNQVSLPQFQLVAFPGVAYQVEPGRWRMRIGGVVRHPYTPTIRKRMILRILGNLMGLTEEQLHGDQYFGRIEPFVSDGARKRHVEIQVGDQRMTLPKPTRRNGHFSQVIGVPDEVVEAHKTIDPHGREYLDVSIRSENATSDNNVARTWLMKPKGLSVISDIDDTIKLSAINDRKELLANTFIREFRSIEGMADVYGQLFSAGASFHYVSSSPWQLLPAISDMLERDAFPAGSVHLRYFRLRNHMLQRMVRIRRSGKITALRDLVRSMPGRRFFLIGDSGEKDLELYGSLAKRFPQQIQAIAIRELSNRPISQERMERFRARAPDGSLCVFREPSELASFIQQQPIAR
jgi:hypothetical protein